MPLLAGGLLLIILAPFLGAIDPTVYWLYVGIGFGAMVMGVVAELFT